MTSKYEKEIWDREDLLEFLKCMEWDDLHAAVKARREQKITMYSKNEMLYFPEQVI